MRTFRAIVSALGFLLTFAAVVGVWAYFEWAAPSVPATIVAKQQRVVGGGRHATPGRFLSASFKLKDETEEDRYLYGSPHITDVQVDADTYDAYDVGAMVNVRYLPINPDMARLEGQPALPRAFWRFALAGFLVLAALAFKRTRLGVVLCVLMAAAVVGSLPGLPPPDLAVVGAVLLGAIVVAAAVLRRGSPAVILFAWTSAMIVVVGWAAFRSAATPFVTATAQVQQVDVFRTPQTTSRHSTLTLQEFDRVVASFVPTGAQNPVLMFDFVDHGSIADLAEGSSVAIRYEADEPQQARLARGTRTHYWKNSVVQVIAVVGMALLTRSKREKGKAAQHGQPAA